MKEGHDEPSAHPIYRNRQRRKKRLSLLAENRFLGLYCHCYCCGIAAGRCACASAAVWPSTNGCTRCDICIPCWADAGPYSSGDGICCIDPDCSFALVKGSVAGTGVFFTGCCGRHYCLWHECLSRWRMGGTLGRTFFQQPIFVFARTRLLAYASWGTASGEAVVDTCHWNIAWHSYDSSCHGSVLRYQPADAS